MRLGVSPLPKANLDESLGLAVSPVECAGSRGLLANSVRAPSTSEGVEQIARSMIGHGTLDTYAALLGVGDGGFDFAYHRFFESGHS